MIGIRILDTNGDCIALFEPPLVQVIDLTFGKYLDGVGVGNFCIPTTSEIRDYLQMNNVIEIIDFSCNEKVIWRGWVRPGTEICTNKACFRMNETKDMLNNHIITSQGTLTSITEALNIIGLPYLLNESDQTFTGIEYRIGMTAYNLLEEIRKVTGYNYDYDGFTITYGRLGTDRTDIGFSNQVKPSTCGQKTGDLFIDNICSEPTIQYDQVVAYNSNGTFSNAGSGKIQVAISSDADNVSDLQSVADDYLERGLPGRIVKFEVPDIPACLLEIGDKVCLSIDDTDDSRDIDDEVFILKTESTLDGCNVKTKITVSETKVILRDPYNVINNMSNSIQNLQTK